VEVSLVCDVRKNIEVIYFSTYILRSFANQIHEFDEMKNLAKYKFGNNFIEPIKIIVGNSSMMNNNV